MHRVLIRSHAITAAIAVLGLGCGASIGVMATRMIQDDSISSASVRTSPPQAEIPVAVDIRDDQSDAAGVSAVQEALKLPHSRESWNRLLQIRALGVRRECLAAYLLHHFRKPGPKLADVVRSELSPYDKMYVANRLVAAWLERYPDETVELARSLRLRPGQVNLTAPMQLWAQNDFAALSDWLRSPPGQEMMRNREANWQQAIANAPDKRQVAKFIADLSGSVDKQYAMEKLAGAWLTGSGRNQALAWLSNLPNGPLRVLAAERFASVLIEDSPAAALELANEIPSVNSRAAIYERHAANVSRKPIAEALASALSDREGPDANLRLKTAIDVIAPIRPMETLEYVMSAPSLSESDRLFVLQKCIHGLAVRSEEDLANLVESTAMDEVGADLLYRVFAQSHWK